MLTPADVQTILDAIRRTPDPRRAPSLDAAGAAWVTWATTIGRPAFDLVQRARAAFPPVAPPCDRPHCVDPGAHRVKRRVTICRPPPEDVRALVLRLEAAEGRPPRVKTVASALSQDARVSRATSYRSIRRAWEAGVIAVDRRRNLLRAA
jgi:hypothetical protein